MHVSADVRDRFRQAASAAACTVHEIADWEEVAALLAECGDPVTVPPSLASDPLLEALRDAGVSWRMPRHDGDSEVVGEDLAVGVVRAEAGVGETGSVLLVEHALVDRVVSMLCRRLVVVVDAEALVASLDDVAAWLADRPAGASFVSLITGPSRTADIERSLTIGVQGPDAMDVVVVG